MGPRVPIGLGVNKKDSLADLRGQGVVARQSACAPVEHEMTGNQAAHDLEGVAEGVPQIFVSLELAVRLVVSWRSG